MPKTIPLVDYLVLADEHHLSAHRCAACGATYFDRRNACANCFGSAFDEIVVPAEGEVTTFSIVSFALPDVLVPFVPAVVDCGGISVRANLINVPADPNHISLGMKVRLATYSLGVDEAGSEAVGFGYEPIP